MVKTFDVPLPASGGQRVPDGTHYARLTQVVGLGFQPVPFSDEIAYRLLLTFEVPSETTEEGKPLHVSKEMKYSRHEASNLSKTVIALLGGGKDAEASVADGYDFDKILGLQASVLVGSTKTGGAKLESISSIPKGVEVPEPFGQLLFVNPETAEEDGTLKKLPTWIQDKIRKRLSAEDARPATREEKPEVSTDNPKVTGGNF